MMVTPRSFVKEWKHLLTLIVHFLGYKDEYEQKHLENKKHMEACQLNIKEVTS